MDAQRELEPLRGLSNRIRQAVDAIFPDQAIQTHIRSACSRFDEDCRAIIEGRGLAGLTVAVIGAKGQGKTWVVRQMVLDDRVRLALPSGVLSHEATTKLYWIGSMAPPDLNTDFERFIPCPPASMIDFGYEYTLLDTPGVTAIDSREAELGKKALSLTPVQILVIRRDQLRSSTSSPIVHRSEGVVCVPVVTTVSPREVSPVELESYSSSSETLKPSPLQSDLNRWLTMLRESAPHTKLTAPILVEDFEATGDEAAAGERFRRCITEQLRGHSLADLHETRQARLTATTLDFRRGISDLIRIEAPNLVQAVQHFSVESKALPHRVVESMLGSTVVLETAVRSRLRTQVVSDTSLVWFPYRTILSTLSLTQGAWDRVVLAMTGSIPSIFGTLIAWTRNVQQARNAEQSLQQDLHERLNRQVLDQLGPIRRKFHRSLSTSGLSENAARSEVGQPSLRGVEELQSRSKALFESTVRLHRTSRWLLACVGLIGTLIFWGMLFGPFLLIYREYFEACWKSLTNEAITSEQFPHPKPSMLFTSVILSIIPMLLYTMIALSLFIRRSKIERLARGLVDQNRRLVGELQEKNILRLELDDPALENASFLLSLGNCDTS
jgi:hypothetical protein